MAYTLFVVGLLCIAISIYLFSTNKNAAVANAMPGNKEKGNAFEDFVIAKICSINGTKLLSKTSDYHKDGISAADNVEPDLKFSYQLKNFAVECKWRKEFIADKISWAKDYQINNYNKYQKEKATLVFVALGIGGTASQPEHLYIIPLSRLKYSNATQEYLSKFELKNQIDLTSILKDN